jgi:hypothetical protein
MIEGKTEDAWVGISAAMGDGSGIDFSGAAAEGALERATGKTEVKTAGIPATRGDLNWTVFSVAAAEEAPENTIGKIGVSGVERKFREVADVEVELAEIPLLASVDGEELELAAVASLASVGDGELEEVAGVEVELAEKIGGEGGVDADRAYTAPQTLGWYRWIWESVTWLQWSSSISCHEFCPTGTRQA